MQYTVYLILAPFAGIIALFSTVISWQRRKVSGFKSLTWLLVCVCGFLFCNILELITPTEQQTFLWVRLSYCFIPFLPIFWIRFALEYTGRDQLLDPQFFAILSIIPLVTFFSAVFPSMHYLLWREYRFESVGNGYMVMVVTKHGIWFWVYAVQGYLLVLTGALLIFHFYFYSEKIFRSQAVWIITGALLPLITNFLYISRIIPGLTKDFSPIGYTFAGICFTIGITHYQLLDLMPIARARLVDVMRDGVIVLDRDNRVVDINPAARKMLEIPEELPLGKVATDVFMNSKLVKNPGILNGLGDKIEVSDVKNGKTVWYDLRVSQITDWRNELSGKLIMINDVTQRKQVEAALRESQEELELRVVERTAELAALNVTLEQRISSRTQVLNTLLEISKIASQATSIHELLDQTLNRTMEAVPCQSAAVYLLEELDKTHSDQLNLMVHNGDNPGILPVVNTLTMNNKIIHGIIEQRKPVLIHQAYPGAIFENRDQDKTPTNFLIAPIMAENRFLGVMLMANEEELIFNPNDLPLLASIAGQVGLAVQSNQLRQKTIIYEERQRLSRDLHDSVTQSLYGLVTLTEAGQALFEQGAVQNLGHTFMRIGQTARQALKEMRLYLYELRTPELEEEGLVGAIQMRLTAVEGRSDISARLVADEQIDLPAYVIDALYQISQEALNNTIRHTLATAVTVRLQKDGGYFILEVRDNGCGFDPASLKSNGMGLRNMKERSQKIHAEFTLSSHPGQGTCVQVLVPLE
jgi:PAS domain S-box-containing protein